MFKTMLSLGCVVAALPSSVNAQGTSLSLGLAEGKENPAFQDIRLVTESPGYLLLVHVANGRVRVMFPGRTTRSSALPAGEYDLDRLEVNKPRQYSGGGLIIAVWSDTPIRTNEFVRYGHWAVSDLNRKEFIQNAREATVALARRLGASNHLVAASGEYGRNFSADNAEVVAKRAAPTDPPPLTSPVRILQRECPSGSRDFTGTGEICAQREPVRPEKRPHIIRRP